MKPTWVLETPERFGEEKQAFTERLLAHGCDTVIVKEPLGLYLDPQLRQGAWIRNEPGVEALGEKANVIAMGSIGFCRAIKLGRPGWAPGVWENYDAVSMHATRDICGSYFLNQHAKFFPWNVVRRAPGIIAGYVGGERFFIKPSACNKLFDGRVVDLEHFDEFAMHVMVNGRRVPEQELVMVAPAYPADYLKAEWRFFVTDGEVITGCQVRKEGKYALDKSFPWHAEQLAKSIASRGLWVDPVYVVDVCMAGNEFKVVELGTFSAAGIYCVDYDKLIEAVNARAQV